MQLRRMAFLTLVALALAAPLRAQEPDVDSGGGESSASAAEQQNGFVDSQGRPFWAKGIVYYQPEAAHHFFLHGLNLARVESDLPMLKDIGFNTLSIDVCWGELVAQADPENHYAPVEINGPNVEKLKALVRQAGMQDFQVHVNVSVSKVPDQVPSKAYSATTSEGGVERSAFHGYFVHNWLVDPAVNEGFKAFLTLLGRSLAEFDNVLAYGFSFETVEHLFPWCREDDLLRKRWQQYLRDRNPDLPYWNLRWQMVPDSFASFDDIPLPAHAWPSWKNYYDAIEAEPVESSVLMWRDYYHFKEVGIGFEGAYGLSYSAMTDAVRKGDPGAKTVFKAYSPLRMAWEMGCLADLQNDKLPGLVREIFEKTYNNPAFDVMAFGAFPSHATEPEEIERQLSFAPNVQHAEALINATSRPVYFAEVGINHKQWTPEQCATYLGNALRAAKELGAIGFNLRQSSDYYADPTSGGIQPHFGINRVDGTPYPAVDAIRGALTEE